MAVSAAGYGLVLGMWHGARLAAYDAIKLPLVLVLTSTFTVAFSWIAAQALSLPLRFAQVAVLTFLALATASVVLLSLAPIAWFFTLCAPAPSTATRTTHNALYLMHTIFVGACGLTGTRTLWHAMTRLGRARRCGASTWCGCSATRSSAAKSPGLAPIRRQRQPTVSGGLSSSGRCTATSTNSSAATSPRISGRAPPGD